MGPSILSMVSSSSRLSCYLFFNRRRVRRTEGETGLHCVALNSPGTQYVHQADLELRDTPASASQLLEINIWLPRPPPPPRRGE